MSFIEHPDFQHEVKRLGYTMEYIEEVIATIEGKRSTFKEDIKDAYKNLDPSDSSMSYTNIMIGNALLEQLEKNYRNFIKIRKKPYFARIDIKPKEEKDKIEKLYIGKASLFTNDMEPVIIDWRAPVVNVYYDGQLGELTYQTEGGTIEAELLLKRQYTINNGIIENMMDIDITAKDAFLQASLAGNANERLKEIASTIQSEQNAIIRADLNRTLVVQGVAGSGKTTIALHRIAYLIYTYEKHFDPDQFMIIAPNNLFLDYISEVLPELGVERVKQTTYLDFVMEIIGQKLKLTSPDERLNKMIENPNDEAIDKMVKMAAFKGSLRFRDVINRYMDDMEVNFIPKEDFVLGNHTLLTYKQIQYEFMNEYFHPALHKRITQIKKVLTNQLKDRLGKIMAKIEAACDQEVFAIKQLGLEEDERRRCIIEVMDKRDSELQTLKRQAKYVVNNYLAKCPKKKLMDYYYELMTHVETLTYYGGDLLTEDEIQTLVAHSRKMQGEKVVDHEDLAPLIYLHYRIFGLSEKSEIKYVVMDEAQDFSLFEFYTLKSILNTERFSIFGDMAQGIHGYRAVDQWEDVLNKVFNPDKSNYLTLEKSYRTTVEIMDLANTVISDCPIPNLIIAQPVLRHGEIPEVVTVDEEAKVYDYIVTQIGKLQSEGFHSIAIIGKDTRECMRIEKALNQIGGMTFLRINGKDQSYAHNLVIVPAHLAKGLEFDGVIIANVLEHFDQSLLDSKLLYVSMTRALHRLSWVRFHSSNNSLSN